MNKEYFIFRQFDENQGQYHYTDTDYPSMMKKHVTKNENSKNTKVD